MFIISPSLLSFVLLHTFLWFLPKSVVVVSASNTSDVSVSSSDVKTERHLILQGCDDKGFWAKLKEELERGIDFISVKCVTTISEEVEATDSILKLKKDQPDTDIHIVASLLQYNHCDKYKKHGCLDAPNNGTNYIPLLKAGVKGWFVEGVPDFKLLNINRTSENIQAINISPNNADGGRQIGREFCRSAAVIAPATIAVIYGPNGAFTSNERINSAIDELNRTCPEARHVIKYKFYGNWSSKTTAELMTPVFLEDSSIDAVIAASDGMALGALISAREILPDKHILVSGYDNSPYVLPLLKSGAMFASVEQLPPAGMAGVLSKLLSAEGMGNAEVNNSSKCNKYPDATCELKDYDALSKHTWKTLSAKFPNDIKSDVILKTTDPSAQLRRDRLQLYNHAALPPGKLRNSNSSDFNPVRVQAGLRNVTMYNLDAAAQSVSVIGVMVLSWTDSRLVWDFGHFPDVPSMQFQIDEIWHPVVVLVNQLKYGSLTTLGTTAYPDGTVVWEQSITSGEFRCGSIDDTILQLPFDYHKCGIDVTSYNKGNIILTSNSDESDFTVDDSGWDKGEVEHVSTDVTVRFTVEMKRDPLSVILTYIIPSWLLNVMSFTQFWIPSRSDMINFDRGGMAITTILAALALRDSMVSTAGTSFTLLDVFLLSSLLFHFIGFSITAYESSYKMIKRDSCVLARRKQISYADQWGKVLLPMVFGLYNLALSIIWAKRFWSLSFLSLLQLTAFALLNRKRIKSFTTDHKLSGWPISERSIYRSEERGHKASSLSMSNAIK